MRNDPMTKTPARWFVLVLCLLGILSAASSCRRTRSTRVIDMGLRAFHLFFIALSVVLAAFCAAVARYNCTCEVLQAPDFETMPEAWDDLIEQAVQWIQIQHKPLGLMLCSDRVGPLMTQACRQAGVAVPEEVAIIGVDNDEPLCAICDPPLTSVCPNHDTFK